ERSTPKAFIECLPLERHDAGGIPRPLASCRNEVEGAVPGKIVVQGGRVVENVGMREVPVAGRRTRRESFRGEVDHEVDDTVGSGQFRVPEEGAEETVEAG